MSHEVPMDRRGFLAGAAAATAIGLAPGPIRAAGKGAGDFRAALSVSPFTELVLDAGITYVDGPRSAATAEALQRIFVAHAANEVYARLGTQRKFTYRNHDHSVERGLERARLAAKLDLPFNPELGLFAQYGDITHQPEPDFADYPAIQVPGPWHTLTLAQMLPILEAYGEAIAREILATGARVNIWDLGNEVERGVAGIAAPPFVQPPGWTYRAPDAVDPEIGRMDLVRYVRLGEPERIDWLERHLWPYMGQAFAAVARGIRKLDPHAKFSTHTSGMVAYSLDFFTAFYKSLDAAGFKVDQPGLSYYPSADAKPGNRYVAFKDMVSEATRVLQRPIFIAEYGYPVGPFKFGKDNWANEVPGFPVSVESQARYLREIVKWGSESGVLSGIRPWAPDLPVPGWGEMSFFALEGKTARSRPAIAAIAQGLGIASP